MTTPASAKLTPVYAAIAEAFRAPSDTVRFYDLETFCTGPGRARFGEAFKQWGSVYERLRNAAARGAIAKEMSVAQIDRLLEFAEPDNEKGRKGISESDKDGSAYAAKFLAHFYDTQGRFLQAIINEQASVEAAKEFTMMWKKYADRMTEVVKSSTYSQYADFIFNINQLATHPAFASSISFGLARGDQFEADPCKLKAGLEGRGPAAEVLPKFEKTLEEMMGSGAHHHSTWFMFRTLKDEYVKTVQPACRAMLRSAGHLEQLQDAAWEPQKGRRYI